MKRVIPAFLLLIFLLCGCSQPTKQVPPVSDLAAQLYEAGTFSTEISLVNNTVALQVYGLDGSLVEDGAFYFSSGASADELALVKAVDADAAKAIQASFENRVLFQADTYADYMPEEVPKLEDALIQRNGVYVLLCVSEDADSILAVMKNYF